MSIPSEAVRQAVKNLGPRFQAAAPASHSQPQSTWVRKQPCDWLAGLRPYGCQTDPNVTLTTQIKHDGWSITASVCCLTDRRLSQRCLSVAVVCWKTQTQVNDGHHSPLTISPSEGRMESRCVVHMLAHGITVFSCKTGNLYSGHFSHIHTGVDFMDGLAYLAPPLLSTPPYESNLI